MNEIVWILIETGIKGALIITMLLLIAAASVYAERKVSAFIQERIGPNRVGPRGLLQPFADVFKLFMKEDIVPGAASKKIHFLSPIIALGVTIAVYSVIPFAHYVEIAGRTIYIGVAPDLNIGILFVLAMTSVAVYGITLAGWSSNNKYSLLGGMRASAQMISYELAMGMSVIGVLLVSQAFPNELVTSAAPEAAESSWLNSLSLNTIVLKQSNWHWNILLQPLGFIIFLVAAFAETNRTPFDLPEAEPELVGGFNTEYSGMKFGMFFLAEYANMFTASAIITLLFLGGWHIPYLEPHHLGLTPGHPIFALLQFATFFIKTGFFVFFFIWVRWTVPRFRYDKLMYLGWKVLLPLSIINVFITALVVVILT